MARERMQNAFNGQFYPAFTTVPETQLITGFGRDAVRRLAAECGAVVKIGKSYRVNIQKLLEYIQREYTV